MNSIPRIRQLEIEIENSRRRVESLREQIETIKQLLAGDRDIYARNLRGLVFASSVPGFTGNLYASFKISRRELARWCAQRGISAKLDPRFAMAEEDAAAAAGAIDAAAAAVIDAAGVIDAAAAAAGVIDADAAAAGVIDAAGV